MSTIKTYAETEIQQRLAAELPRWSYAGGELVRCFHTAGWKASLLVANSIGHLAEAAWHHPDLLVSYGSVTVKLRTHSAQGITDKDFALAAKIEDVINWRPPAGGALEGTPDDPRYAYLKYD